MSDNRVYINAPTLDNADECTFDKNISTLTVKVGQDNRGENANLIMHEKVLRDAIYSPADSYFVPTNRYKPGMWSAKDDITNGIDPYNRFAAYRYNNPDVDSFNEATDGGDYHNNGCVTLATNYFKAGLITHFFFKFFSQVPLTEDEELQYYDNIDSLAFMEPASDASYRVYSYANKVTELDETDKNYNLYKKYVDDNWTMFELETPYFVSTELTQDPAKAFAFAFYDKDFKDYPRAAYPGETNPIDETKWEIITKDSWRSAWFPLGKEFWDGSNLRTYPITEYGVQYFMRSHARSSADCRSYIFANNNGSVGIKAGQSRLIECCYKIVEELVDEYIGDNSVKYHLSEDEFTDLNMMRYTAPQFRKPIGSTRKLVPTREIYISDASVTKHGLIDCLDTSITSIVIPFRYSDDLSDYFDKNTSGGHDQAQDSKVYFYHHSILPGFGLCNYNIKLAICLREEDLNTPEKWIISDNPANYSYFENNNLISFNFSGHKDDLKYKGEGIWIRAYHQTDDYSEFKWLGVHYCETSDTDYYQYAPGDYIKPGGWSDSRVPLTATADIKILFNFYKRSQWFETLEGGSEVTNTFNDGINIGSWSIYPDADGNLIIKHADMTDSAQYYKFNAPS